MRQYALLPEGEITPSRATLFQVVSNFATPYVFASHLVTDASGQESEIYDDYTLVRWVESGEGGFTAEQATEVAAARTAFNQGRDPGRQLPQELSGSRAWAAQQQMGRILRERN